MQNTGTSIWTAGANGYTLNFVSGNQLGSANTYLTLSSAVSPGGTGTFTANLYPLSGAAPHPDTAKWWVDHQDAYLSTRVGQKMVEPAMLEYVQWVKDVGGKPVFVAYPAGFDWTFMYWYMIRFAGDSPFGFSALDVKTLAMVAMGCPYRHTTKRNMPKRWFPKDKPHTHVALDDAIEQGWMFLNILKELPPRK
jgi:hypothetical protein